MRLTDLFEEQSQIQWIVPKLCRAAVSDGREVVVWVNVSKIEESWKADRGFYVGPQGTEGAIKGRYERFDNWIKERQSVEMSQVCFDHYGRVHFTDGRHRFAWMRDHSAQSIPVVVPDEQQSQFEEEFGAAQHRTIITEQNLYFVQPDGTWKKNADGRSVGRTKVEVEKLGGRIDELFNSFQAADGMQWEDSGWVRFKVSGNEYEAWFDDTNHKTGDWTFAFSLIDDGKHHHSNTGKAGRSAVRVYAYIVAILEKFISTDHPRTIYFSGKNSEKAGLYGKMAAVLKPRLETLGYSIESVPGETQMSFVIRKNKKVTEADEEPSNTKAFKQWFKNSKVATPDGKPIVVYHGTGSKFRSFNMKKQIQNIVWFTSDKSEIEAGEVGAAGKGHVLELYASIQNPAGWDEYDKLGLWELQSRGYDGAILKTGNGFHGFVFKPTQLKSAVKNNGNYDEHNKSLHEEDQPHQREPLPPQVIATFQQLGDMQRGAPEHAMLRVQHQNLGGVLNPVVEHTGDLVHRMTHLAKVGVFDYDISNKVERCLRYLESDYGFVREHLQNVRNNAEAKGGLEKHQADLKQKLYLFYQEHAKLPAYNRAQWCANHASMALGLQKWDEAVMYLHELKAMADSPEGFSHFAMQYKLDAQGHLIQYPYDLSKITELFDPNQNDITLDHDGQNASAIFTVGDFKYKAMFTHTEGNRYMFGFAAKDGKGNYYYNGNDGVPQAQSIRVFSNLIKTIEQFLKEKHPNGVFFAGDTTETGRLYVKLAKYLQPKAKTMGYTIDMEPTPFGENIMAFTIDKADA